MQHNMFEKAPQARIILGVNFVQFIQHHDSEFLTFELWTIRDNRWVRVIDCCTLTRVPSDLPMESRQKLLEKLLWECIDYLGLTHVTDPFNTVELMHRVEEISFVNVGWLDVDTRKRVLRMAFHAPTRTVDVTSLITGYVTKQRRIFKLSAKSWINAKNRMYVSKLVYVSSYEQGWIVFTRIHDRNQHRPDLSMGD